MKKYILVRKNDKKIAYGSSVAGPQVFQYEDGVNPDCGGSGKRDWYWVDVTTMADADIKALFGKTHTPSGSVDANAENVVTTGGTWL